LEAVVACAVPLAVIVMVGVAGAAPEPVRYPDNATPPAVKVAAASLVAVSAAGGSVLSSGLAAAGLLTLVTAPSVVTAAAGGVLLATATLVVAPAALLATAAGVAGLALVATRAWYHDWGTLPGEASGPLPGDHLLPDPDIMHTRAITVGATPEDIWPWLVQMGGDRGGFYSYELIEKSLACPIRNADRVNPAWQGTRVGDPVPMCPEGGPVPYEVVAMEPGRAFILGHRREDRAGWHDTWQFVLRPLDAQHTRLVVRTRTLSMGPWDAMEPGVFIMERGMLRGIKRRAESTSHGT
jgi:hypothetical protein